MAGNMNDVTKLVGQMQTMEVNRKQDDVKKNEARQGGHEVMDVTTVGSVTSGAKNPLIVQPTGDDGSIKAVKPPESPTAPPPSGGYGVNYTDPESYRAWAQQQLDEARRDLDAQANVLGNPYSNALIYAENKTEMDMSQARIDYFYKVGYDGDPSKYTEDIANGLAKDPDYVKAQEANAAARAAALAADQSTNSPPDTTPSNQTVSNPFIEDTTDIIPPALTVTTPPPTKTTTKKAKAPKGFELS